MTETERKALALVNEIAGHDFVHPRDMGDKSWLLEALCRAIEQHEAFKREVSDAVEHFKRCYPGYQHASLFDRFIIAKPDPLVEAWQMAFPGNHIEDARDECAKIIAAIVKRGGKIVWGEGE